MAVIQIRLNRLAQFEAIHYRHHDITYHQIHIIAVQYTQCFRAIGSCQHRVIFRQLANHKGKHIRIIFRYQHSRAVILLYCLFRRSFVYLVSSRFHFRCQGDCRILYYRQSHTESIILLPFSHSQSPLMQFGKRAGESQPDAGSGSHFSILLLVETNKRLEYLLFHCIRNDYSVVHRADTE